MEGMSLLKTRVSAIFLFCLGVMGSVDAFGQDPQFTQFYANPLYLNPAFAGTENCPRVTLNYRNQWPGLTATYVTYAASYDQNVQPIHGGIGFQVLNDRAGQSTLNTTRVSLQYSYFLPVTRTFNMRFGVETSFFQRSLDWSKLTFGDMIDARRGFVYNSQETQRGDGNVSNLDFSAGFLGYTKQFFFGFAVHHLTEPNESLIIDDSPLPRKYTGHIGGNIPISEEKYSKKTGTFVSPNLLYMQQADFRQLLLGVYFTRGPLVAGAWYRNQDAFILLLGFKTDLLKFGYSYDITVSKLSTSTAGSHEISLGLQFDCRVKSRKYRMPSCPSF